VASPRPVRIVKSPGPARVVRVAANPPTTLAPAPTSAPAEANAVPVSKRDNSAARARAWRIVAFYLVALAAMYAGFLVLELRGPGAGGSLALDGTLVFSAVAVGLAVGGLVVTLAPVPRSVEVSPNEVVVIEWMGRRRKFPPLHDLRVEVVRRYSASFLSSTPVEAVELHDGRRRRTYQLTLGVLPEHRPPPKASTPA
jgi:hypothetical protein